MSHGIEKALPATLKHLTAHGVRNVASSALTAAPSNAVTPSGDVFARLRPVAEKLLSGANQHYGRNMADMAKQATLSPAARAAAFRARHEVSLAGKTGVVTGAAGNIGSETAFMMAHNGMNVVLADIPRANLDPIAETCSLLGAPDVLIAKHDLVSESGRLSLISDTVGRFGDPYALVHCAGMYLEGGLHHSDPEQRAAQRRKFDLMMQINAEVPVSLTEAFEPYLQPGAHVTAINSLAGEVPVEGERLYCMSKYALDGVWETMRKEYGRKGIKLSQIFPSALLGKMAEGREGLEAELLHFPNPIARAIEAAIKTVGNSCLPRIPVHGVISPYRIDHPRPRRIQKKRSR